MFAEPLILPEKLAVKPKRARRLADGTRTQKTKGAATKPGCRPSRATESAPTR